MLGRFIRADYIIGVLDYHHKKGANAAQFSVHITKASVSGTEITVLTFPPATVGTAATSAAELSSQGYQCAKATWFQSACKDLITF